MIEFVLPTVKDDLLKSVPGQFNVEEVLSSRLIPVKLQDARSGLIKTDGLSIEDHFEVFYSILCKFNELDIGVKRLAWTILLQGSERFCLALHKALENEKSSIPIWESPERIKYLNSLKMFVYLLVQMSDFYQSTSRQSAISSDVVSPKKRNKKVKSKDSAHKLGLDWENECAKSFQLLMNFVDLDIHRLWSAQLVEDEFTSLISNFCYKVLEDSSIIKNKTIKSNVMHLLGCIIKKHNQSLSTSLKVVQMMQHFEHISGALAEAVELWVSTYKCRSIIPEILRELSNIEERELVRDSVSTRTICNFIQDLAKVLPAEILPHVSLLMSRMDEESYPMRNTVLSVFSEILVQCLNGEDLSHKSKSDRDQFLDILYDHANLDVNAFVRSKAVQIITNLVKSEVLPIKRCSKVADLGIRLLLDKSNLVRKAAVQLLEGLLRWNPFAATLSISVLKDGLDDAKKKMEEFITKQKESSMEKSNKHSDASNKDCDDDDTEQNKFNIAPETDNDEEEEEEADCDDSEKAKLQKVCTYLSDAVEFVEKFHEAVPVLCHLLKSKTQSDVLEAINFFTTAWEFKLGFAVEGISGMLDQIWNEDQKIRDAVVGAYKEFYFKLTDECANQVQQIVDNMMVLAASSTKEKLQAFEALLNEMNKSGDIISGVAQLLWNRFVNPPSSFTMERGISEAKQRKVAVQLLGMLANRDPSMLKPKIGVLVDVGLKEETLLAQSNVEEFDYELSMHTCVTLLKLSKRDLTAGTYKKQFRLSNQHKIFTTITDLLIKGFTKPSSSWVAFALEASTVLFQLASKPGDLSKIVFEQLFATLNEHYSQENSSGVITDRLLSRFFAVSGHFALKFLVFVDGDIQSELKRRRKLEEEKEESAAKKKKSKRKSNNLNRSKTENLEEDMGVGGATADDADQEVIKNVLENEIVAPGTMLGSVTELIVRSCTVEVSPDDQRAVQVQLSASLALSKYMLVSSEFCEKHMRLFFTMLQSSPHEGVRANLTIAAGDLCVRFPNLMEPWTSNIYARLNDQSSMVRIYAIKVLTNLILHDMIKVKGHVSEMAKCIADENNRISMLARRFFQELSKKGNSVYNVMPDIISRLSDPDVGLKDEVDFKSIMRFLFDFIQKDKQSESLVEKLCHRFKATRDIQQWRDLAFCLSLLNYSEKAVKKLIENFSFYSNTLRDEQVYYLFNAIITKSKKFAKPELKIQIDELEGKIIDHHTEGMSEDESSARAAEASKRHKLSRPQSVSQAPPETPKKKFKLTRSLSVSCEKLSVKHQIQMMIMMILLSHEGQLCTFKLSSFKSIEKRNDFYYNHVI